MHETEAPPASKADDTFTVEVVEREDPTDDVIDEIEVRGFAFPRRTGRVFSRARF